MGVELEGGGEWCVEVSSPDLDTGAVMSVLSIKEPSLVADSGDGATVYLISMHICRTKGLQETYISNSTTSPRNASWKLNISSKLPNR